MFGLESADERLLGQFDKRLPETIQIFSCNSLPSIEHLLRYLGKWLYYLFFIVVKTP